MTDDERERLARERERFARDDDERARWRAWPEPEPEPDVERSEPWAHDVDDHPAGQHARRDDA
jgi:hypothetical protein